MKNRIRNMGYSLGILILASILAALSGCMAGMVEAQQGINSNLVVLDYNDLSSQYMPRPTFVSINKMRDGHNALLVKMNAYGVHEKGVRFFERDVDKYIAAIDKYIEWAKIAENNGDVIEKDISIIPTPNGDNVTIAFQSNGHVQYLIIGSHDSLMGTNRIMALDEENALVLKKLLQDLPQANVNDKSQNYN
jgi:hypothetical protein